MRSALLVALALAFVVTGCGATGGSGVADPAARSASSVIPSTTSSAVEKRGPFGAMSITRTANGFTVTGEVPDQSLKTDLPATLRQAMPGAKIVDQLTVKPGVTPPEFSGLGALFGVAMDVQGFGVKLVGNTATLTGSAKTDAAKTAAETAVKETWPNVNVANDIRVG
ncbi:BON domain-containing protein [Mycolicibacterium sp. P1-18]|uniref:channel-forming protein ArfA/OmpATb n=1 Tax=Mycolicibacterium sp. P1-18 TaxID=2024615 RepID=UPI0011F1C7CF|nr:BON domain-containing protein [Mycolicibacterium sp. P1-18]KAA0096743.1 BON domain-containing protein [Mycolicibacterium sp. P1-18]